MCKKSVRVVALLLLMTMPTVGQGQSDSLVRAYQSPCQSEWTKYSIPPEQRSIVRSNLYNHIVYVQEKNQVDNVNRHIFIVRGGQMPPYAVFSTIFVDPCDYDCLDPSIEIYDMRIYDNVCYFCGKIFYPGPLFNGEHITNGFVGYFRRDDILNRTGSVYYQTFPETKQLTRLAISKANGGSLLISAIGYLTSNHYACILELENTGGSWTKMFDTIEGRPEVDFADIITCSDSLTLLAQYTCANDNLPGSYDYDDSHEVFLLIRFGLDGCHNSYNTTHRMFRYSIPSSENYIFHYNKAPMRLFHINDKFKQFGVAFGVESSDGSNGGIRLFSFKNAWMYDSCIFYQTGLHAKIKDIGNLYKSDSLFVLSQDNSHTNGMIAALSLGGASHDVTWLTNNSYTYNSLTQKIRGEHIDISGHDDSYEFHLFDQNIHQLSLQSCFDTTNYQYDVFTKRQAQPLVDNWIFSQREDFEWIKKPINTTEVTIETICSHCDEQQ